MKAIIGNKLIASLKPQEKPYEVRDAKLTGFILRVQPSGVMTFIAQYARGKRVNIGPASVLTPAQARERVIEILADVVKGNDPQEEKRKKKEKKHILESFLDQEYSEIVETDHRNGAVMVKRLKACFVADFGKKKLSEITKWDIDTWRRRRLNSGVKPATVNREIAALKGLFRQAVEVGTIISNPLAGMKLAKIDSLARVRYLDDDEENALRAALDAREETIRQERASANAWRSERGYTLFPDLNGVAYADHLAPMILLSLNSGLRRGELFNLRHSDVDLDRALLTVRGEGSKSGKTRHVPLNAEALTVLEGWLSQATGELVFPGRDGKRLKDIKTAWSRLVKDAGVIDFRFHDLRHTFASNLVMAGVDLNTVRELLGHADIKMTLRYAHLAPEVKAAAVAKLVRKTYNEVQKPSENIAVLR